MTAYCNCDPPQARCVLCFKSGKTPRWEDPTKQQDLATCRHLGAEPVGLRDCPTCGGRVRQKEFACTAGLGVGGRAVPTLDCSPACPGYFPKPLATPPKPEAPPLLKWAVGVTTVPARRGDLLPRTLRSLAAAGFAGPARPRLFVDGADAGTALSYETEHRDHCVSARWPALRVAGGWWSALLELYIRQPDADRYAIFQDDVIACRGLRAYLERVPWGADAKDPNVLGEGDYLNLVTYPENQALAPPPRRGGRPAGFYPSNQRGKGAQALVFRRVGVVGLLTSPEFATRPQNLARGWRNVDGGIADAFRAAGQREWVHDPSLCRHVGEKTTFNIGADGRPRVQPLDLSFRGEGWDALEMLG